MNPSSGSFSIQEMLSSMSPSQPRYTHYEPPPPPPPSFLNEQILLSAAALAASHSYPPPSSYLSNIAASNLLSSINAHLHSITPPSTNYFEERRDYPDSHLLPTDVKNLIESSLTAIGLDNVDDNDFDKAATNAQNSTGLLIDDDMDSFERSTTPATSNTSPAKQITRPVNIPNSFPNDYFSPSSSAKSPFDAPNQLFDEPLESVCLVYTNDLESNLCIFSPSTPYFPNHRLPVARVVDLVNCIKWLDSVKIGLLHLSHSFND